MTDKTCGTCANVFRNPIYPDLLYCHEICEYVLAGDMPCIGYVEHTDSLEQWALDALDLLRKAERHPLVLKPNAGAGGQTAYASPTDVLAERLRALGVES